MKAISIRDDYRATDDTDDDKPCLSCSVLARHEPHNPLKTMTTPYIEQDCTVTFKGRASGGAVVTDTHLVAYPRKDGVLADWHGKQIGTWRTLSSRPAIFFGHRSWIGERYYYMRASVNGRAYSLRGFGVGMVAMGKAVKS